MQNMATFTSNMVQFERTIVEHFEQKSNKKFCTVRRQKFSISKKPNFIVQGTLALLKDLWVLNSE